MIFPKYRDKEGVSHMVQEQLEEVRQNITERLRAERTEGGGCHADRGQ